jgi:hypothetical protein
MSRNFAFVQTIISQMPTVAASKPPSRAASCTLDHHINLTGIALDAPGSSASTNLSCPTSITQSPTSTPFGTERAGMGRDLIIAVTSAA